MSPTCIAWYTVRGGVVNLILQNLRYLLSHRRSTPDISLYHFVISTYQGTQIYLMSLSQWKMVDERYV